MPDIITSHTFSTINMSDRYVVNEVTVTKSKILDRDYKVVSVTNKTHVVSHTIYTSRGTVELDPKPKIDVLA